MATYKDKLDRIISALSQTTGLTNILPGSKAYQLAESVAYEQMQLEYGIEQYAQKNSLLLASGSDLDRIGSAFFNVQRLTASAPFVTEDMKAIKFYVASGTFGDINYEPSGTSRVGKSIELFEGTLISGVTADGIKVVFRTTNHYTLQSNKSEVYVAAELVQGQYDIIQSNTLKSHNFSNYTQAANGLLLVSNPTVIATGRTAETDENYRYRLVNALSAFPKTTLAGIHETVTSLADVSNAIIVPSANGGGTFDVYVQGVSPVTSDATINNVVSVLADSIAPWVSYNVLKPYYIGIEAQIKITMARNTIDQNAVNAMAVDMVSRVINNSFATQFYIRDILTAAANAHQDIASAEFVVLRQHYGAEGARRYEDIDFIKDPNYAIFIGNTEKLIVESVKNAITVTV